MWCRIAILEHLTMVESLTTATVVHVRGDVDVATRKVFEAALESAVKEQDTKKLVVSLEHCRHCDSTGLGALIRVYRRVGERLTIVLPKTGPCRRIFEVSGLVRVFTCVPTLDEALAGK